MRMRGHRAEVLGRAAGVRSLVAGLLVVCGASLALAAPAGSLTGRARDALQRALPGARIHLQADDGRLIAETTADAQGRFTFTDVGPGTYAVLGEAAGFETATAIVTVPPGEGASVELTLPSRGPLDVTVQAPRLPPARAVVPPSTGASTYEISGEAV